MLEKESKCVIKAFEKLRHENVEKYVNKPRPKNLAAAESARLEGNRSYQQKKHDVDDHVIIWEKYTMSIALAPTGSETLAMAYGNRSALLFHLSKFEDCIVDVDRAVGITKSNELKIKLLCRKAKCFHALDDLPNAEKALEEAKLYVNPDAEKTEEVQKVLDLIEATEKVLSTKYSKPSGIADEPKSSAIKIEPDDLSNVADVYNSKFGRHLVATRDIAPGEVVLVEKPYCASILHFENAYPFCTHCYAACLTTIPCDLCPVSMYCSEKCKNEAWNQYHDVECLISEDPAKEGGNNIHLFTRCVITECRDSGGVANFRAKLKNIKKKKSQQPSENVIINGQLKCSKFELACKMHESPFNYTETFLLEALRTIISLATNTSFFGKKYDESEAKNLANNKDVVFIGSLILKVGLFTAITRLYKRIDKSKLGKARNSIMGFSTFSIFTSLHNHNCDPNVETTFSHDNGLIVYAIKPIKKDDQILSTNSKNYAILPKQTRQVELLQKYRIICNCQACEDNWPFISSAAINAITTKPVGHETSLFKNHYLNLLRLRELVLFFRFCTVSSQVRYQTNALFLN